MADIGLGRDWVFTPYEHVIRVNTGAALSWANARYMQSYFGVSPEESQASGNPVYTPGSGLRDLSLGLGMNTDLGPRWVLAAGFGMARVLGPALDSPLTGHTHSWGVNAGLAWRF
jgi:outer membrane scaffolding protein for murein synthesis (MipA/OmpV family)